MGTPISSRNCGVLALGASTMSLCARAFQSRNLVLLLGHKDNLPATFRVDGETQQVAVANCRLSPRARKEHLLWILVMALIYRFVPIQRLRKRLQDANPWIHIAVTARLVGDIRGGDSFSDIYGLQRFLWGFVMQWVVILVRGEIIQFPQTYGPYKSRVARVLARFLLLRSSVIIARDLESKRVAQGLVGNCKTVLLSPDVAFSLEPVVPENIQLDPPSPPSSVARSSPIVGVNVNGLMFNGGYNRQNMFGLKMNYPRFLKELLLALAKEQPGEIWLVPHTYAPKGNVESDNDACFQVRDALPEGVRNRVRIVTAEYDAHHIKGVIGLCDFFVGSRMHSCIAALSQGIPCVGVAYSMKFRGVFESVGMAEWVADARSLTTDEALARVLELYRSREGVRPKLALNSDQARQRLNTLFADLASGRLPSSELAEPQLRSASAASGG